jgi:hypothetical protein
LAAEIEYACDKGVSGVSRRIGRSKRGSIPVEVVRSVLTVFTVLKVLWRDVVYSDSDGVGCPRISDGGVLRSWLHGSGSKRRMSSSLRFVVSGSFLIYLNGNSKSLALLKALP